MSLVPFVRGFFPGKRQQLTAVHVMFNPLEVILKRLFKKWLHNGVDPPALFPYRLRLIETIPLLERAKRFLKRDLYPA
jgi:hypothetical protein